MCYKTLKTYGNFGKQRNWNNELRMVDFGYWYGGVKFAIRRWEKDTDMMGFGVDIDEDEMRELERVLSADLKKRPAIKRYGIKTYRFPQRYGDNFSVELVEEIAVISRPGKAPLKLCIMIWDGREPKYDLRRWPGNYPYDKHGIVLRRDEIAELLWLMRRALPTKSSKAV